MQDQNDQEQEVEEENPAGCLKILGIIIAVGAILFFITIFIMCAGGELKWRG